MIIIHTYTIHERIKDWSTRRDKKNVSKYYRSRTLVHRVTSTRPPCQFATLSVAQLHDWHAQWCMYYNQDLIKRDNASSLTHDSMHSIAYNANIIHYTCECRALPSFRRGLSNCMYDLYSIRMDTQIDRQRIIEPSALCICKFSSVSTNLQTQ